MLGQRALDELIDQIARAHGPQGHARGLDTRQRLAHGPGEHAFTALGFRNAEPLVRPALGDLDTDVDQVRQRVGVELQVLAEVGIEAEAGRATGVGHSGQVEGDERPDELAVQGARDLAAVGKGQVPHHVLVHLAERVGAAAAVGLAGQGRAQDDLRLRALAPLDHGLEGRLLALRGFLEVDDHALGDDAGRVVAEADEARSSVAFSCSPALRDRCRCGSASRRSRGAPPSRARRSS